MYIRVRKAQPYFVQGIVEFAGPDPWAGGDRAVWTLALYRLGYGVRERKGELSLVELKRSLPAGHVLGLFCRRTNRCVLIPYALSRLWQEDRVVTEVLPGLMHRAECAGMVDGDLIAVGPQLRKGAVVTLSIGAVLLGVGGVLVEMERWEVAILIGFLSVMMLGLGVVFGGQVWWWDRRQKRASEQWRRLTGR